MLDQWNKSDCLPAWITGLLMHKWLILDYYVLLLVWDRVHILHLESVWTSRLPSIFSVINLSPWPFLVLCRCLNMGRLARLWWCMLLKTTRSMIHLMNAVRSGSFKPCLGLVSDFPWYRAWANCTDSLLWSVDWLSFWGRDWVEGNSWFECYMEQSGACLS